MFKAFIQKYAWKNMKESEQLQSATYLPLFVKSYQGIKAFLWFSMIVDRTPCMHQLHVYTPDRMHLKRFILLVSCWCDRSVPFGWLRKRRIVFDYYG